MGVSLQLYLVRITRMLIVLVSASFVIVITYAIGSRYLFGFSIVWIEEIARFLLAWIVFLGISVAVYERGHISMDALRLRLAPKARRMLDIAFDVLMIVFLAIVFLEGLKLAISVLPQTSPALRISYFWPYLSMPVGACLAVVQLLFKLWSDVRVLSGLEVESDEYFRPPAGV